MEERRRINLKNLKYQLPLKPSRATIIRDITAIKINNTFERKFIS